LKEEVLSAISKEVRAPEEASRTAENVLKVVDEALAADRYELASRLAAAAIKLAARTKDPAMMSNARLVEERSETLHREWSRLESKRKILRESPGDPAANLDLGRFFCFLKGDWTRGLPMLAKSDDVSLKAASELDLAGPKAGTDQVLVGRKWAQLAEKQGGSSKKIIEGRALLWFEAAHPNLNGLEKAEVGRKIASLLFGKAQVWETSREAAGVALGNETQNVPADCTIEFWFSTTAGSGILLSKRQQESDASLTLSLEGGRPGVLGDAPFYKVEGTATMSVNDGRWHHLAVVKINTRVLLYVDGRSVAGITTRPNLPSRSPWVLGYHGSWQRGALEAKFCKIRLSKIARYSGSFTPRGDYSTDKNTLFLK
jgi:hypothetical protein